MTGAGKESGGSDRPRVCIVTSELVGPYKNGGIGTSMTGLALCLADAGFPVTVLYTGGKFSAPAAREHWHDHYARRGIALDWIAHEEAAALDGPVVRCGFPTPWLVYLYLRARSFDVVQFNDCMGEGFYCLAMKRLGAAFGRTAMFVGLHSPSQWIFEINRTLPDTLLFAAFNHAERLSTRAADLLWSPSRYMLDWTRARGFTHSDSAIEQKYVLPDPVAPLPGAVADEALRPREIVFFGRIEERKGLKQFCAALAEIGALLVEQDIAVTFLGKPGTVGDRPALAFLDEQARDWRWRWSVLTDLGQQEAIDYLRSRPALAVMASPADNSPCTVYEALAYGIPFLAARTGGIPELIAEDDRDGVLFDDAKAALAAKLRGAICNGAVRARPAEAPAVTRQGWIRLFEGWRDFAAAPAAREPERRLLIVIDGGDEADLATTLASLEAADVAKVALIGRRWRALPGGLPSFVTLIPPDAPERLAGLIGENPADAVLTLRAGTALLPGAAERLAAALRSPAVDGLIPAASLGKGQERTMPPLGGSAGFCLFEGAAAGGACAIKADRLLPLLENRTLPPDCEHLGLADLAIAAGLELWPFAEPLLSHPDGFVADLRSRRAPERIAAYAAAPSGERFYMTAIGYGGFAPDAGLAGRMRALKERLVKMRLGWTVQLGTRIVPSRLLEILRAHRR